MEIQYCLQKEKRNVFDGKSERERPAVDGSHKAPEEWRILKFRKVNHQEAKIIKFKRGKATYELFVNMS